MYAINIVFFSGLTYWYGVKANQAYVHHDVIRGIVEYPAFPLKFIMFFGLLLLTVQLIIDLLMEVAKFLAKPAEPPAGKSHLDGEVTAQ
jgi:hypothetical protein